MRIKHISQAIGCCLLILFAGGTGEGHANTEIHNLQQLERIAEAGDVEAQLRLAEFYKHNRFAGKLLKEKEAYWRQKAESAKATKEYAKATEKIELERKNEWKDRVQKLEQKRKQAEALKQKYENHEPQNKSERDARFLEAAETIFDYDEILSWDKPYHLRYRLTVNIKTPEGVKSGSTIQEVYYPPADTENPYNPANQGIARGEAAYVDLGKRGKIFVLMPDPANAKNRFFGLIRTVFPTVPKIYEQTRFKEVLEHYDELSNVKDTVPEWEYPVLAHFRDINDPSTIEVVYRRKQGSVRDMQEVETDRMEEVFGEGVSIKNMTLEMTDAPLEWKLNKPLPWIEQMTESDITRALRKSEPRIRIINGIAYYIFRQGEGVLE